MLGSSLSSSCTDGEEGMQVATHAAAGWFAAFGRACMYVRQQRWRGWRGGGGEGGVSLSL